MGLKYAKDNREKELEKSLLTMEIVFIGVLPIPAFFHGFGTGRLVNPKDNSCLQNGKANKRNRLIQLISYKRYLECTLV